MNTGSLLIVDLLVAALVAATWLGAGVTAAVGRTRVAAGLFAGALTATLIQVATVLALAGAGWWFVQDKVTLTLPLLGAAGAVAAVVAGPPLVRCLRSGSPPPGPQAKAALPQARIVVVLLTAGYAAVAGLAVTFLVGYPVGGSVILLSVALVGAAGLVTWRVLVPARVPARTRAAAGCALLGVLGAGLVFLPEPGPDLGGGPPAGSGFASSGAAGSGVDGSGTRGSGVDGAGPAGGAVPVHTLRGPEHPAAGGEVRRHTLTAQQATVTLGSGREVAAWTFDGQVPGPAITAVEGDLVEVRLRNADIADGVTLHWHGYDVPSGEDGVPGLTQDAVAPGEEFTYRFRADQVGTYWYHTHRVSDRGVRMGLYGTLLVTPREPSDTVDFTVPVHTFQGVTVVGDQDRPQQHRVAPGAAVRLRLINTDDAPRRFTLAGAAYRLVAVDGRDLRGPGELAEVGLRLPAGGRYDLRLTMPDGPVALLVGDDPSGAGLRLLPEAGGGDADQAAVPDTSAWPELDLLAYGQPAPTPFGAGSGFDRDFTLVLDRGLAMVDGAPRFAQTVNGRGHPSIPPQLVAEGDLVRFTVVNRSLETHPWHLHGHPVLVLARDGEPPGGSPLWLDTFDVRPGEVWEVGFRADNPGLWMNHCHNLPHAHDGMMLHLAYDGVAAHH